MVRGQNFRHYHIEQAHAVPEGQLALPGGTFQEKRCAWAEIARMDRTNPGRWWFRVVECLKGHSL